MPLFITGGIGAFILVFILFANIVFEQNLDMNPMFKEADIVGTWQDDQSRLEFAANKQVIFQFDNAYKSRVPVFAGNGTWSRKDDFEIIITINAKTSKLYPLRVIKVGRNYHLILEDFDDPDLWDHHLGFKKKFQ